MCEQNNIVLKKIKLITKEYESIFGYEELFLKKADGRNPSLRLIELYND